LAFFLAQISVSWLAVIYLPERFGGAFGLNQQMSFRTWNPSSWSAKPHA